jgi:hypothetical protein
MLNRRDILCLMNLSAGHEKLFLSEHVQPAALDAIYKNLMSDFLTLLHVI